MKKRHINDGLIFTAMIAVFYGMIGLGFILNTISFWAFLVIVVATIISLPIIHLISERVISLPPTPSTFIAVKLTHVVGGLLMVLFTVLFGRFSTLTLLVAFIFSYSVYLYFWFVKLYRVQFISNIFNVLWGKGGLKDRLILGSLYGMVGLFITFFLFEPNIANVAVIGFVFGDATAAIIGKKWGKHPWFFNDKTTVEGSISGIFIVSIILSFLVPLKSVFTTAIIGMIVEALPWPVNDNISVPVSMGVVLKFIR